MKASRRGPAKYSRAKPRDGADSRRPREHRPSSSGTHVHRMGSACFETTNPLPEHNSKTAINDAHSSKNSSLQLSYSSTCRTQSLQAETDLRGAGGSFSQIPVLFGKSLFSMFHDIVQQVCFTICLLCFTICFTICLFISPDLDGYRAPKMKYSRYVSRYVCSLVRT